jgi:hypothetical protein
VPDPSTLNALYGGKPIDQVWDGATADIPGVPVNGTLLREQSGAIFVVFGGAKFHVPDPSTLNALYGGKPIDQVWDGATADIPGVPVDGTLLREQSGAIFVVFGGAKFHVPDPSTLTALYGGKPIDQVWDGATSGMSNVPAEGTLLREVGSAQVYVIRNGKKVPVTGSVAGTVDVLWNGALSAIPGS